jgi:hypothetical protein
MGQTNDTCPLWPFHQGSAHGPQGSDEPQDSMLGLNLDFPGGWSVGAGSSGPGRGQWESGAVVVKVRACTECRGRRGDADRPRPSLPQEQTAALKHPNKCMM